MLDGAVVLKRGSGPCLAERCGRSVRGGRSASRRRWWPPPARRSMQLSPVGPPGPTTQPGGGRLRRRRGVDAMEAWAREPISTCAGMIHAAPASSQTARCSFATTVEGVQLALWNYHATPTTTSASSGSAGRSGSWKWKLEVALPMEGASGSAADAAPASFTNNQAKPRRAVRHHGVHATRPGHLIFVIRPADQGVLPLLRVCVADASVRAGGYGRHIG